MTESCDQWFRHFEIMVTTHFPVLRKDADAIDTASILETWNQHFGSSHRVYEKQHPFPGLIVNYEDGADDEDRDPSWLSRMFEYGFSWFSLIECLDGHVSSHALIIHSVYKGKLLGAM